MEITFKILAVILAGIAAFFLWKDITDGAFVSTVFRAFRRLFSVFRPQKV